MRVAVLKGGRGLERQVSLRSGARVEDALLSLGHEVVAIDVGADLVARLKAERPEVPFIALHGVGGLIGTVLTPMLAVPAIAPVTATPWVNLLGAVAVLCYAGLATWTLLQVMSMFIRLRVDGTAERIGLDIAQHGEMVAPPKSSAA